MSNNDNQFDSYLSPDFEAQLNKLIDSQGTDVDLGKEIQLSIIETCKEINAELSKSFADLNKTGFDLPSEADNSEGDEENE